MGLHFQTTIQELEKAQNECNSIQWIRRRN